MDLKCPRNRAVWGRVIEPQPYDTVKARPVWKERSVRGDRDTEALHAQSIRQAAPRRRPLPGAPTQSGVLSGSLLLEILLPLPARRQAVHHGAMGKGALGGGDVLAL